MSLRPVTVLLSVAALVLLTACSTDQTPPIMDPPSAVAACGADQLQSLVGKSARVLETMKFGVVTRVIRPGMAVTMDYAPDRLNIEIDAAEIISRVSCG